MLALPYNVSLWHHWAHADNQTNTQNHRLSQYIVSSFHCVHLLEIINKRMVCIMKTSRKSHQSSRPPSSRSVSRQKLHRLSGATAATAVPVARPPSVFNKIPLLPPIGATAATSVSPGYNSDDASVPLGASANPAAETLSWSPQAQCSSTLSTHVENDVDVTPPAVDSVTLTPSNIRSIKQNWQT